MEKNDSVAGQSAIETFFAILIIMALFVIVSMISAQKSQLNNQFVEADQNASLCNRLSLILNQLDTSTGNTKLKISIDRAVSFTQGSINFGGNAGYYCYYQGRVIGDDDPSGKELSPGDYWADKNESGVKFSLVP